MKAVHGEEYFRKNMDVLMEKYRKHADLEKELRVMMMGLEELPEQALEVVRKMYAQQIADNCKANLLKTKKTIIDIKAGRASLGYTTLNQEISAMHDLVEGFEFTCLCLADFKKKYRLGA